MATVPGNLDSYIEQIFALDPLEIYKPSHKYLVDSMNSFKPLVNNYLDDTVVQDIDYILELLEEVSKGNDSMNKAIEETQKLY